jgi:3-deoxy-D-manno-octulosonic-acid transferase
MLSLYNTLLIPPRPIAAMWELLSRRSPTRLREASERMARRPPPVDPGGLWIHGSSVGEARIVASVAKEVRRLYPGLPLAASAFTRTGRAQLPRPPEIDAAFFLPFDFSGFPARVLRKLRPAMVAIVETELWPNLIHEARGEGVPTVIINGRISPKRVRRYHLLSALYAPLLKTITAIGAQSEDDARRFAELGASPSAIEVTGNIKYDLAVPERNAEELRARHGIPAGIPVLVAGSTGPGEEALVLEAFEAARATEPRLHLILAPRHPERADEVERLIRERRLQVSRLSRGLQDAGTDSDVLLVDTVGQLGELYQLGTAAFVGGSLVPVGGHNVLEPAAVGVPVLFGPHTEHFAEPAAALEDNGGGRRVKNAAELGRAVEELLGNEEERMRMSNSAQLVISRNRGAVDRTVAIIESVLQNTRSAVEDAP